MYLFLFACQQSYEHPMDYQLLDMNMKYIPAGSFCMGGAQPDALPVHKVYLTQPFWLSDIELTQQSYEMFVGKNPSQHSDPQRPVENILWKDALLFLNALSTAQNLSPCYKETDSSALWDSSCTGYRLPTEAEWEYAATSNPQNDISSCPQHRPYFSGGEEASHVGWFKENAYTSQTGRLKKPNNFGLYDMSGNVAEWVWDGYGPYPEIYSIDPKGVDSPNRISRGGGWADHSETQRLDARSVDSIEWSFDWVGMRIARSISTTQ